MKVMVHVAFVVSRLNKGGPNNQLYYICKYLDISKVRFTIITISPPNSINTYHDEIKQLGVCIIELKYGKIEGLLRLRKDLKK
jgi:hypothetical protein